MKEFLLNNVGIIGSILFFIIVILILLSTKQGYITPSSKLGDICSIFIIGSMFYGAMHIGQDLFNWLFK